jgi:glyoxylase-like metal-dependent hydrolase (beta-lactamase superfamily II)
MKELAPDVWHLNTIAMPNAVNAYLVGDVLVDAGGRRSGRRILRALRGHEVSAHALTHAHPDHQGASHEVCEKLGVPFWVGERDVDAAERPELIGQRQPGHPIAQFMDRIFTGPGHKVDRTLREGDEVAGFRVLDVPGHSAGHVALWRESDRVLVAGDVLNSANPLTGIPGLRLPYDFFTPDPDTNRRSAKRLGELEPSLVLLGHGPPVRNTRKFVEFCAGL